ncbi:sensor histidine kinase [Nocardia sp. NPDC003963]
MIALIAEAAHDLRTPIAGIRAAVEAILAHPPGADEEELNQLHHLVLNDTQRAARLIDDLLDISRLDSGKFELHRIEFEMLPLVSEQAHRARLFNSRVEIDVDAIGRTAVVADPIRIAQILTNLIDNACRVTRDGGRVSVTIAHRSDRIVVVVADSGPGIPKEDRDRVFGRGIQLCNNSYRHSDGAGLGLAISRGIARAHGGDLTCVSPRGGVGATFLLSLPLLEG